MYVINILNRKFCFCMHKNFVSFWVNQKTKKLHSSRSLPIREVTIIIHVYTYIHTLHTFLLNCVDGCLVSLYARVQLHSTLYKLHDFIFILLITCLHALINSIHVYINTLRLFCDFDSCRHPADLHGDRRLGSGTPCRRSQEKRLQSENRFWHQTTVWQCWTRNMDIRGTCTVRSTAN